LGTLSEASGYRGQLGETREGFSAWCREAEQKWSRQGRKEGYREGWSENASEVKYLERCLETEQRRVAEARDQLRRSVNAQAPNRGREDSRSQTEERAGYAEAVGLARKHLEECPGLKLDLQKKISIIRTLERRILVLEEEAGARQAVIPPTGMVFASCPLPEDR
jgi:hypothetical protein